MAADLRPHRSQSAPSPRRFDAPGRARLGLVRLSTMLACIGGLLAGTALAQDDPPGRVGRIGTVQGEVWVYEAEQSEWVPAQRNRPFTGSDRLSTGADGRVELSVGSTSMLLGASAELEALQLDDERIALQLHRGHFAVNLRSGEVAAETKVFTAEGRFDFQRGGLYRIDRRDDTSAASVWRGDMSFQHEDFLLPLQAGQGAEFWLDGAQRTLRSRLLPPLNDAFAAAVQQLDAAGQRSVATDHVSPEMTGIEELDQHGRWEVHPDHGALWVPTVVVAGWAPYAHGHWTWLRPWGWTWVDDAPWGFAPFHYGRWLWWRGRWGWTPGPRVARPVFAPALVAWVGGKPPPAVVGRRGRVVPGVGWVPLAPREAYRPGYRASAGYVERVNVGRGSGSWAGAGRGRAFGEPPGVGNRYVPGAVTLPGASATAERVRRDGAPWPIDRQTAPGTPQRTGREQVSPRRVQPIEVPSTSLPSPSVPAAGRKPFWPADAAPHAGRPGADAIRPMPARVDAAADGSGRGVGRERGRQGGNDGGRAATGSATALPAYPAARGVPAAPAGTDAARGRGAAPIAAAPSPTVTPQPAAPPAAADVRRPFVPPPAAVRSPPEARGRDDTSPGRATMRTPQSRANVAER